MRWMMIPLAILTAWTLQARADDEARTRFFLGSDSVEVGEFEQAISHLEIALELDPTLCRAHYYLAAAHLGLGTAGGIQIARSEALTYQDCASVDMMMDVEEILKRIEAAPTPPAPPPPVDTEVVRTGGHRAQEGEIGPDVVHAPQDPSMAESLSAHSGAEANYELRRKAGTGMLVGGLLTCAGGIVGNIAVANYGYQNQEDDQLYESARNGSNGLLVAGIAGGGVAVTGLLMLVIPEQKFSKVSVNPGPVTTVTVRF